MNADALKAALRALPSVDTLLGCEPLVSRVNEHGRVAAVAAVRHVLEDTRGALRAGRTVACAPDALARRAAERLAAEQRPNLRPVFNLTGTVLHTNLGRAPLADAAREAVWQASGACNIEYDLEQGRRGQRDALVEDLICRLTGAEAAVVVNNNAAAVLLVLNTLALARDVLVSRGELIEIGDAFRIPDIMMRAGCRLHEVGTTNRTHGADYREAVDEQTALIMRVYPSNYAIQGFSSSVPEKTLAAIAQAHELPLAVDLGSGSLIELADFGLPHEPTPRASLDYGADVVTFSGDKLLGGPQAGLIVGRRDTIQRIRRNPLKRALRCDKLTLAALEATLRLYSAPEHLRQRLPTLRLLTRTENELAALGARLLPSARGALADVTDRVDLVACESQIGSGSLPVDRLPSRALRICPPPDAAHPGTFLRDLAAALAALPVPVIGRVRDNGLELDLRCLEDEAGFVRNLASLQWPRRSA